MLDFEKYKSELKRIGKYAYVLWNDAIYLKLADIMEDESILDELSKKQGKISDSLYNITKNFNDEKHALSEEEYESVEDKIEEIESLISKLEYKLYGVDVTVFSFNKLWGELNSSKYLEELDNFIQEIPESVSYIKINRLQ